jgi:hypothetical protein
MIAAALAALMLGMGDRYQFTGVGGAPLPNQLGALKDGNNGLKAKAVQLS